MTLRAAILGLGIKISEEEQRLIPSSTAFKVVFIRGFVLLLKFGVSSRQCLFWLLSMLGLGRRRSIRGLGCLSFQLFFSMGCLDVFVLFSQECI